VDSDDLTQRIAELGARVNGHPEHVPEVVPQLLALLDEHDAPRVIADIIDALGCSWDEAANLAVLPYADHPAAAVRLAVTRAIPGGTDSAHGTELVAEVLMRLTRDDVDEVRDWATFGLGSILPIDTTEVRDALFARVTDSNEDVRDEAVVGLAQRRDPRAAQIVSDFLSEDTVGPLIFEAAEYLCDARVHEELLRWNEHDPDDAKVKRALHACSPELQQLRTERHTELLAALVQACAEHGAKPPFMYCDRGDNDVFLTFDAPTSPVWFVDRLIERADGDLAEAARIVMTDLDDREQPNESLPAAW
jgi:hypothetical protein